MRIILVLPTNMLLVCDATMAASAYVQEEPKPEEEPEDAAFPQVFQECSKGSFSRLVCSMLGG